MAFQSAHGQEDALQALARARVGLGELSHELSSSGRVGLGLLEETIASMGPSCPPTLMEAYDNVRSSMSQTMRMLERVGQRPR